jgi:hypothetical protein
MSRLKPWQRTGVTLEAAEIGFDILRTLAHAKEAMTPIEIRQSVRPGSKMIGMEDGYVQNALRIHYKLGNIECATRVNRLTMLLESTRFSITEQGRQLLGERQARTKELKMAIPKRRKKRH